MNLKTVNQFKKHNMSKEKVLKNKNRKKYNKMDPLDHILHRPDTYVGSNRNREKEEYVSSSNNNFKISKKIIKYSPAILRTFIEILSNAIDNVARSEKTDTPCTKIKVSINKETSEISIWNDGDVIPIEIDEDEKCYNHTLIFGQLLTSSNYDDEQDRYNISGRNGIGGKATNVFSSSFIVKGVDPENGKKFIQEWKDNMKTTTKPKIKSSKLKKGYTEIIWTLDFKQFNMEGYTQDIIDLYCKYVVDAAMLTGVNVYFNDVLIPVKNLNSYAKLYFNDDVRDILYIKNKDSEIVLTPSSYFEAVSFANGVYTSLGGTHVNAYVDKLFRPIVTKLSKPKGVMFTLGDIKKYFKLFVKVNVVKPEFESQSKHRLESPIKASVETKYINKVLKWSIIDDIKRSKEMGALKKLERKKRVFVKIESLDPANNAGGPKSSECTLILVEGLSAKTFAVQGIEVGAFGKQGRDSFGIYALRGKNLNVRNSSVDTIAKNKVVSDIIKSLGLRHDVDYTKEVNYKTLRYGRVMILTDQDCDGLHISSLVQNFFHSLFPSLLERETSYITAMHTPIVRVFLNKKNLLFYDERKYHQYVKDYNKKYPGKKINKKYYKGLGTSSSEDILETFGKKIVEFEIDENTTHNMNKIFGKKFADSRKVWLENYDPSNVVLEWKKDQHETVRMCYSDFLNTETIKFSLDDCKRSIPNFLDGLKESQRKVLYACFLKKLKTSGKTLKVAQLAGYVAEKTGYHHGEQNLYDTITKMAHAFPGSNNIPLLYRDGQFGSLIALGKDAANARYIFTKLDELTRLIFREEDDVLLERVVDDGDDLEPKFYVPIIPMILVNGVVAGIGTGWSCNVPSYNPLDLINAIHIWLDNDGDVLFDEDDGISVSSLPELTPWYREYEGVIENIGDGKYTSYGNITQEKKNIVVDELPIGMSINSFKNTLDQLQEEKMVKEVKNYSSPKKARFVIKESPDGLKCNLKNLKLHKTLSINNMVMFTNFEHKIHKFKTVDEIIDSFCKIRLEYYVKRKKYMLDRLNHIIKFLGNKKRFLQEVLSGDIKLFILKDGKRMSRKTKDLILELEESGYDKDKGGDDNSNKEEKENERDEKGTGYDYLLRLQFRSITEENINKLEKDIESNIKEKNILKKKSEKKLWIADLDELEKAYCKWEKKMRKEVVKVKK